MFEFNETTQALMREAILRRPLICARCQRPITEEPWHQGDPVDADRIWGIPEDEEVYCSSWCYFGDFCNTDGCESEAVLEVEVSEHSPSDSHRWLCRPCAEAYEIGAQHGRFLQTGKGNRAINEIVSHLERMLASSRSETPDDDAFSRGLRRGITLGYELAVDTIKGWHL